MNICVLNSGSSSVKFQLIQMPSEKVLFKGLLEGISQSQSTLSMDYADQHVQNVLPIKNHAEALKAAFQLMKSHGFSSQNVQAAAHRVVHGGEKYSSPTLITAQAESDIQALCELAPLHNPANLAGIFACKQLLPGIPNYAVFDTAFHQTLPPEAYLYGLPYELYEKYRIRKYGFHGISHKYVSQEAMKTLKENIKDFKIISCHLGSGGSVCAIKEGKSIETSMGFTPLEGLMMGTRAGSFDPEIILYLLRKGFSIEQIEDIIHRKSGLRGISQTSYDVRDLREDELSGKQQSELAFKMFVHRVKRFIGSYTAVLEGLDVLIFTGGVGEKAYYLRRRICESLDYLGLKLEARKNRSNETIISSPESKVMVMVIPTNEELQIARETFTVIDV